MKRHPLERIVRARTGVNMDDAIVNSVRQKLAERSATGIKKYGTTMERTDLSRLDWLRHAQEELLDGAVYLERLIQEELARPNA